MSACVVISNEFLLTSNEGKFFVLVLETFGGALDKASASRSERVAEGKRTACCMVPIASMHAALAV